MGLPVYVACPGCGAIVAPGEARLVFEKAQHVVEDLGLRRERLSKSGDALGVAEFS